VALIEPRKLRKRSEQERRERPIDRDLLTELWTLDGVAGRDRLFWRMAYETWARADELLGLNIADLDPGRREGQVHGKGGDVETVWWATGAARLLPRVVAGRTTGPLFLAARRPTKPMPAADVDPHTGRAPDPEGRLSCLERDIAATRQQLTDARARITTLKAEPAILALPPAGSTRNATPGAPGATPNATRRGAPLRHNRDQARACARGAACTPAARASGRTQKEDWRSTATVGNELSAPARKRRLLRCRAQRS
jgi:hypothetical protein